MKKKLNWQAISGKKRINIIEQVKEAISKNHGFIINFNIFSDIALSLNIELEESQINQLHSELCDILIISEFDNSNINNSSKEEWLIFMNITFSKGKGDLKTEIPMVSG